MNYSDTMKNEMPKKVMKKPGFVMKPGTFLARLKGFEPLTFWSVARHSIQLS